MEWGNSLILLLGVVIGRLWAYYNKSRFKWKCPYCDFIIRSPQQYPVDKIKEDHLNDMHR